MALWNVWWNLSRRAFSLSLVISLFQSSLNLGLPVAYRGGSLVSNSQLILLLISFSHWLLIRLRRFAYITVLSFKLLFLAITRIMIFLYLLLLHLLLRLFSLVVLRIVIHDLHRYLCEIIVSLIFYWLPQLLRIWRFLILLTHLWLYRILLTKVLILVFSLLLLLYRHPYWKASFHT